MQITQQILGNKMYLEFPVYLTSEKFSVYVMIAVYTTNQLLFMLSNIF